MKKCRLLVALLVVVVAAAMISPSVSLAAGSPRVASDTAMSISRAQYSFYQFRLTVYGTHAKPSITVGDGKVLQTQKTAAAKDKQGNDVYYFLVKAVGAPGSSAGVYTKLPGQKAVKQCVVRVVEKTVPYQYYYAGFVLQNSKSLKIGARDLPNGDTLFATQKEWNAFRSKYLSDSIDLNYARSTDIDFSKDSVLYHSQNAAKQDVMANAYLVDKVVLENGKPVLYGKDFGGGFRITAANYSFADHKYVVLVLLKKSDLNA